MHSPLSDLHRMWNGLCVVMGKTQPQTQHETLGHCGAWSRRREMTRFRERRNERSGPLVFCRDAVDVSPELEEDPSFSRLGLDSGADDSEGTGTESDSPGSKRMGRRPSGSLRRGKGRGQDKDRGSGGPGGDPRKLVKQRIVRQVRRRQAHPPFGITDDITDSSWQCTPTCRARVARRAHNRTTGSVARPFRR